MTRSEVVFVACVLVPLVDFMDSVGLPTCEGYGLTENASIITINTPYDRMIGSLGRKFINLNVIIMGSDGNHVEIKNSGEI